jgi:hypothetical protein
MRSIMMPLNYASNFIRISVIKPASEKANMTVSSGSKHARNYRNGLVRFLHFTQEHIAQFISYIVDEKMSMKDASKKANIL